MATKRTRSGSRSATDQRSDAESEAPPKARQKTLTINLDEAFECAGDCGKPVLDPPVYLCKGQHIICDRCHKARMKKKGLGQGLCPACGETLTFKQDRTVEKIIGKLRKNACRYEECTFAKADPKLVEEHEVECDRRTVAFFDEKGPLEQVNSHLRLASSMSSPCRACRLKGYGNGSLWPCGFTSYEDVHIFEDSKIDDNNCFPLTVRTDCQKLDFFFCRVRHQGRHLMWVTHAQSKCDTRTFKYTISILDGQSKDEEDSDGSDAEEDSDDSDADSDDDDEDPNKGYTRLVTYSGFCSPPDVSADEMREKMVCLSVPDELVNEAVELSDETVEETLLIECRINPVTKKKKRRSTGPKRLSLSNGLF